MATNQNAKVKRTYQGITGNITVAPYILSAKQISDWVTALNTANNSINPQRRKLYELYNRIELDGQVETVTNLRTIAITNKQINFLQKGNEGQVNEALLEQIRSPWFSNMLNYSMQSRFWGHSLIEFKLVNGLINDTVLVPRSNVNPEKSMFFPNYSDIYNNDGLLYKDQPISDYCFEVFGTRKLGLFSIMAPYVLYKAGAMGDLAQFCELFAIPFRSVKYNPFDEESRRLALKALEEQGSAGYVVLPQGTDFEIHDTKGSTSGEKAPSSLIRICDEQIGKVALGGTMSTDNGSSRSQAEVHYEVKEEINLNDMIWIEYLLNWEAKTRFANFGLPVSEGKFEFHKTREIPLEKRIEMDVKVATQVPIAAEYWYHTYGIPEPDGADEKIKVPANPEKKEPGAGGTKVEKKKLNLSDIHHSEDCCNIELSDTPNQDAIEAALAADAEEYFNNPTEDFIPQRIYKLTASTLFDGITKNWGSDLGNIAYNQIDNALIAYLRDNIFAFSAAKSFVQRRQMSQALVAADGSVNSFSQFKKQINVINRQYNVNYLNAEYNHAIAAGQMASTWLDISKHKKDFPNLKYVTAGDSRVRPAHQVLNGKILKIDDSFWKTYYPPNGWNCRCTVVQMDETAKLNDNDETSAIAGTIKKEKYFRQNVGQTGIVWNEEHPNFKERNVYDLLATKNYNLPSVEKIYVDPNRLPSLGDIITDKAQYDAWWNEMVQKNGVGEGFGLNDIFGHTVYFDSDFKKHATLGEKRVSENRMEFARQIQNVITKPDEVWSRKDDHKKNETGVSYLYIKYYGDMPLIVRVKPEPSTGFMKAYSSHDLNMKSGTGEKNRKGILLYNKTAK